MCVRVCVRVCVYLTSNTQSDGDQRSATVRTMSHEVILSAPLRLRSLYANVWWSSGLLCEGATMFYSNSWKVDISVEQTFKVNTKRPSSWSIIQNDQILTVCIHFHAKALKYSWHKHRQAHIRPHTHTIEALKKTHKDTTERWIGAEKMFQVWVFWLMAFSGLHHHYIIFTRHLLSIHEFSYPYIVKVAIIFLLCVQQLKATEQNAKTLCM